MHYEEKLICGILHWRGTPDEEWRAMSKEQMTAIVMELRQQQKLYNPLPWWQLPIVTCKNQASG